MYGAGSAYPEAGRAIVSYMVKGEGVIHDFEPRSESLGGVDPGDAQKVNVLPISKATALSIPHYMISPGSPPETR